MACLNLDEMPMQSCDGMRFWVMKSMIRHDRAGMGFFARVHFLKRVIIEYYSGMQRYTNL